MRKFEEAFSLLDESVAVLKQSLDIPFIDAYVETAGNILQNSKVRVVDGEPSAEVVKQLETQYQKLAALGLEDEDWRKVLQLVLLKGNHEESLQANYQLTPDTIGFLFVFILRSLYIKKDLKVLDISCGMANLMLTIALNLHKAGYEISGFGVDTDETMLEVAEVNTELCHADFQFFHQDGLQKLLIEPVDVAVADLPIGFYPNDEKAQDFKTATLAGHSYAHHLLMEQAMRYVKEEGFGLFLLPSNFLESDQAGRLKEWLGTEVYLQGMIQLPEDFFQSTNSRKSIVLLQKAGGYAKQAKEVLLINLGSLKDPRNMTEFLTSFEDWQSLNL